MKLMFSSCSHQRRAAQTSPRNLRQQQANVLTLPMLPAALLMGEEERPAGPFKDMLVVVGAGAEPRVTRGATKPVHEDDASTTRAAGR